MNGQDPPDSEAFKRVFHKVGDIDLEERRKQVFRQVRSHLQARGLNFLPKKWQIAAATEICEGRDCFVITRTGSGKSLVYQMIPMVKPRGYVLVICPLLALMREQVIYLQIQTYQELTFKQVNSADNFDEAIIPWKYLQLGLRD